MLCCRNFAYVSTSSHMIYFHKMLRQRWDDVLQYIKPFNDKSREDLKRYSPYTVDISIHIHDHRSLLTGCFIYRLNSIFQLEYIVHHQQFLEALSWQGGGGHRHALLPWKADGNPAGEMDGELEVEVVVELLKSLEKLCPSQVSSHVASDER